MMIISYSALLLSVLSITKAQFFPGKNIYLALKDSILIILTKNLVLKIILIFRIKYRQGRR